MNFGRQAIRLGTVQMTNQVPRVLPGLLVCLCINLAFGQSLKDPKDQHPRLYWESNTAAEIRLKIQTQPEYAFLHEQILGNCDSILELAPAEEIKEGRRLLAVSRTYLKRILYLAYAFKMTGHEPYLQKAKQELLAASNFGSWNPDHFLDVAEMAMGLAIGYDWLFDELSEREKDIISRALLEKGIQTSLNKRGQFWIDASNNWNPVCHGGLTAAAIAIFEKSPDQCSTVVQRAIANVPKAMEEYRFSGNYPEGPMYWEYGTTYNLLLIDALQTAYSSDFGLLGLPGFLDTSKYYRQAIGPSGLYFNYSDCRELPRLSPAQFYFSKIGNHPELLRQEGVVLERYQRGDRKFHASKITDRFLPFVMLWSQDFPIQEPMGATEYMGQGSNPIGMYRSSWARNALYLGIKAGSPSVNHGHMDAGSFVFEKKGIRWATDLGLQDYHSIEKLGMVLWKKHRTSERWKVFRNTVFSHNTLVVNDSLQNPRGFASLTRGKDSTWAYQAHINLTNLYTPQIARANRTFEVGRNGELVITDSLRTGNNETNKVRWGFVTPAKLELMEEGRVARLSKNGEFLMLELLSPKGPSFKTYVTDPPPSHFDAPNPGTVFIGLELLSPGNSDQVIKVRMY